MRLFRTIIRAISFSLIPAFIIVLFDLLTADSWSNFTDFDFSAFLDFFSIYFLISTLPFLVASVSLYFFKSKEGKLSYWFFSLVPIGFSLWFAQFAFISESVDSVLFAGAPVVFIFAAIVNYRAIIKNRNYPEIGFRNFFFAFIKDRFLIKLILKLVITTSLISFLILASGYLFSSLNNVSLSTSYCLQIYSRFFCSLIIPILIYILFERDLNTKILYWLISGFFIIFFGNTIIHLKLYGISEQKFLNYLTIGLYLFGFYFNYMICNKEIDRNRAVESMNS